MPLSFWVPLLDAGVWEPLGSKLGVRAAPGLVSWRFLEELSVPFFTWTSPRCLAVSRGQEVPAE